MESIVVLLVVLMAAAFITRRVWMSVRAARSAKAGCTDCGCSTGQGSSEDWSKS